MFHHKIVLLSELSHCGLGCLVFASRLSRLLLVSVGLASVALPVQAAFRKDAAVSLEASYEDNVDLSRVPRSNSSYTLGGYLQLAQESARFTTDINLQLQHEINSDTDDRTIPSGTLSTRWTMLKNHLFWNINDTVQQTRVNSLSLFTRDNSLTSNTISTGPDFILPLGASIQWRTSARRDRIDYSHGSQVERERDTASTSLNYAMTSRWSTYLARNWAWEGFSSVDRKVLTDSVGINYGGDRFNWGVSTGKTAVDGSQLDSDVYSANVRYRFSQALTLVAVYDRSVRSDISDTLQLVGNRLDDIRYLAGECVRNLGNSAGACSTLPGVSAGPVSEDEWVYQRENSPVLLSESDLLFSYLSDFRFDNALFESEEYRLSLSWRVNRIQLTAEAFDTEQTERFDETVGLIATPDVISKRGVNVSANVPITGRVSARLGYEIRKPRLDSLVDHRTLKENQINLNLKWAVEPMLSSFFNVGYYDASTDLLDTSNQIVGQQKSDRMTYAVGFRYEFQ